MDFNGDGMLDVVTGRSLWLAQSNGSFVEAITFPGSIGMTVLDVNGDQLADLAFSDERGLQVSVQLCMPP